MRSYTEPESLEGMEEGVFFLVTINISISCLLNKWLDPAATDDQMREFLEVLSTSHWIDIENPANSKFLTDLCGFGGPMFHIFTREELELIAYWIRSLHSTTPSILAFPHPYPFCYFLLFYLVSLRQVETTLKAPTAVNLQTQDNLQTALTEDNLPTTHDTDNLQTAQVMVDLMTKKTERAKCAHGNRTMANAKGESKKINEWFQGPVWELLDSLRHTYRLDTVTSNRGIVPPFSPSSPFPLAAPF